MKARWFNNHVCKNEEKFKQSGFWFLVYGSYYLNFARILTNNE